MPPTCTSEGSRATRSGGCTRAVHSGIATSWTAYCGPGGVSRTHHFPPRRSLGGGLRRKARGAFSPARLASRGHRLHRLADRPGSSVTWPTRGATAASVSRGRWELNDVRRSSAARLAAALSALPKRHPRNQVPPPSRIRTPAPRVPRVRAVSSSCPRCRRSTHSVRCQPRTARRGHSSGRTGAWIPIPSRVNVRPTRR